jgi:hypothetical protein
LRLLSTWQAGGEEEHVFRQSVNNQRIERLKRNVGQQLVHLEREKMQVVLGREKLYIKVHSIYIYYKI